VSAATLSVDRATVTRTGDGSVTVDDPGFPLVLRVRVRPEGGRTQLLALEVSARGPDSRITAGALGRLPLAQVVHVAAHLTHAGSGHPNEAWYRQLAVPRPAGRRSWPAEHWPRVRAVYEWAEGTGRPGGGMQAVADLWDIAVDPTVERWMARVRRLAAAGRLGPVGAGGDAGGPQ
jgi:hypothetical protein